MIAFVTLRFQRRFLFFMGFLGLIHVVFLFGTSNLSSGLFADSL